MQVSFFIDIPCICFRPNNACRTDAYFLIFSMLNCDWYISSSFLCSVVNNYCIPLFVLTSTSKNSLLNCSCNLSRWLFIASRKSLISFSILSFCFLIKSALACLFSRIRVIFLEITDTCCCRSSKETDVLTCCIISLMRTTSLYSLWFSMMHFLQQGHSCDLQTYDISHCVSHKPP